MTTFVAVSGRNLFRSEITAARALGFALQTRVDAGFCFVRLAPETDRARKVCAAHNAAAIEARVAIPTPADTLDVMKLAIDTALDHARQGYA